ncbi:MAG: ketol-acid reductoisomerase [Actinobacteria bacterium]|nr:MAG: ketol-acid reductoisomerase [Actinomycetota bacterium]
MVKIYSQEDANIDVLKDKTIAVIGYGNQGHAHALNLKDSGLNVVVGLRPGSKSTSKAESAGLKVLPVAEAAKVADVIMMLIPDQVQKKAYDSDIANNLEEGNALMFAHGFNIHFGRIKPSDNIDVLMIAPKGPGHMVRKVYEEGRGVPALIAIQQDYTGNALQIGLAYADGIGASRAGILETTFREETETDLFGEQTVLCGGLSELIKAGFDTLVAAGYQPEVAYFECLHEVKLIADLVHEKGITGMRAAISDTAEYGDITMGKKIINQTVRKAMAEAMERIQKGEFAEEWIAESDAGCPNFNKQREEQSKHQIENVGKEVRSLFSWAEDNKEKNKVGAKETN